MTNWKFIDNSKLTKRAQEYFGGDVQRFEIIKRDLWNFEIRQYPHWGDMRVCARSYGPTQRDAIKEFNGMARNDDKEFA